MPTQSAVVPSPPQPASRWPGLVASLGGESAVRSFTDSNAGDGGPDRWLRGVMFRPNVCVGDINVPLANCDAGSVDFEDDIDCPSDVDGTPVVLWSAARRSNFNANDNLRTVAEDKLTLQTSFKLEREWWRGDGAQALGYGNQYLADSNITVLNGGTATPLAYALTWLQREGGTLGAGQRLFIYAPPAVVTLWQSAQVVRKENGLLLDLYDNIVVAGTGFDGSDDAGDVDSTFNTAFAYATLTPAVRLSSISSVAAVDQTNNTNMGVAFRWAHVAIDPCVQIAVNVDACTTCCTP